MPATDKPELLSIGTIPAFDDPGRVARARGYMDRMCVLANEPDQERDGLAGSTLLRLQMSSSTVLSMGLPDLVLRQDEHGRWYVFDKGAWTLTEADWDRSGMVGEADASVTEAVTTERRASPRTVPTEVEASPRSEGVPTRELTSAERTAARKRRHREAHRVELAAKERERRARERGE